MVPRHRVPQYAPTPPNSTQRSPTSAPDEEHSSLEMQGRHRFTPEGMHSSSPVAGHTAQAKPSGQEPSGSHSPTQRGPVKLSKHNP